MTTADAAGLEAALLARAQTLAAEYLSGAQARREELLAESNEHLRLREERELLAAKAAAEAHYRRQVQAAEIRSNAEFDRLRWTLVQAVLSQLDEATATLSADEATYLPLLKRFIAAGVNAIPGDRVIVALNARDRARLAPQWSSIAAALAPDRHIELDETALDTAGGALVRDPDNRLRIDHTFEGRRQRLHDELARIIIEKLFVGGAPAHG